MKQYRTGRMVSLDASHKILTDSPFVPRPLASRCAHVQGLAGGELALVPTEWTTNG